MNASILNKAGDHFVSKIQEGTLKTVCTFNSKVKLVILIQSTRNNDI